MNKKMKEKSMDWVEEFNDLIEEFCEAKMIPKNIMLIWLMATLSGQYALCNCDEEFVKASFSKIFDDYKKIDLELSDNFHEYEQIR